MHYIFFVLGSLRHLGTMGGVWSLLPDDSQSKITEMKKRKKSRNENHLEGSNKAEVMVNGLVTQ